MPVPGRQRSQVAEVMEDGWQDASASSSQVGVSLVVMHTTGPASVVARHRLGGSAQPPHVTLGVGTDDCRSGSGMDRDRQDSETSPAP